MKITLVVAVAESGRQISKEVAIAAPPVNSTDLSAQAIQIKEDITSVVDGYLPRLIASITEEWENPKKEEPKGPVNNGEATEDKKRIKQTARSGKPPKPPKPEKPVETTKDEPPTV